MFLGDGKEAMAIVFWGSGLIPLLEMMNPAKEISVQMENFFLDIVTLMLAQRSRIFRILDSRISKVGAQIKMSLPQFPEQICSHQ